jgi:hypothetical protein
MSSNRCVGGGERGGGSARVVADTCAQVRSSLSGVAAAAKLVAGHNSLTSGKLCPTHANQSR